MQLQSQVKQKPIRLLLFAYEFPPLGGGVATAVKNLLEQFSQNPNLKIDLITSSLKNTWEVEKISENIGIYKVPIGLKNESKYQKQRPIEMWRYLHNSYRQAKDLLEQHRYDLAHFFGYPGAWQGYLLQKKYALPYLISLRGVEVPFYNPRFRAIDVIYRPLVARLWQKASKVVANSVGLADLAKQTNQQIQYQVIPNGVDTDFFKPLEEKAKFKKFTITAGGSIMGRKKGLDLLISAFAKFARAKKQVELLLIGDGDLREKLEEQVKQLKIVGQVKFVGRKTRTWLQANLPKCHVFCLPSLNEGMSNATLEALACGLPVIITPVGGSQELLSRQNGFLLHERDEQQLAGYLEQLYAEPVLRIRMGRNSRQLAEQMSWKKVAERYEEVYCENLSMKKVALVARGLSKNGVRSFIETNLAQYNLEKKENFLVFTDESDFVAKYPNLKIVYIKKTNKLWWDNVLLLQQILKLKIDEVIYTKNIIPFTHLFFSFTKTIYVLDLAFKYPALKAYKKLDTLYMNVFLGLSLKFAKQILAISQFTKDEIIKLYPQINPDKIIVQHLKISSTFKKITDQKKIQQVINKYGLQLPFIFYCGSISPRKNILSLLRAFQAVQSQLSHRLYLLSSRQWNAQEEMKIIEDDHGKRIRIISDVSDEELVVFYSIADLFVYPSLYEGFGLPIKEAEACGCKVLCADIPTSREIGRSILIFEPNSERGLARKILKFLK